MKKEHGQTMKLPEGMLEQFGTKSWYGKQKLPESLFIWKFRFGGYEFPGWDLVQEEPAGREGGPSVTSSLWQPEKKHAGPLIQVETFECASREAAHEFVLGLLSDFSAPGVHHLAGGESGDAMFSAKSGDAMAVFVRGNLAVRLRNAERELAPVFPLARQLDTLFIGKPAEMAKKAEGGPVIVRFAQKPARKRAEGRGMPEGIVLEIAAEDPDDYPVWFKFFAPGGEVVQAGTELAYRPAEAGSHEITAIAVNSAGMTSRSSLVLKTG